MTLLQRVVDKLVSLKVLVIAAASTAVLIGIFSLVPRVLKLELAFTGGQFHHEWQQWTAAYVSTVGAKSGLSAPAAFRLATTLDFLFIPSYAVLLAALYLRAAGFHHRPPPRPPAPLDAALLSACGAAAVLDVLENVGLFVATAGPPTDAVVRATSIVSAFKWSAIAVVAIFIVRAFVSGMRGRIIWLSRYTILSMALGTVPLLVTAQGRDLLLGLGDRAVEGWIEHRVFFYVALVLWGLSVWYWTRVILDAEFQRSTYEGLARRLPRDAGALTIALPGFPILLAENSWPVKAMLAGGCFVLAALFYGFVIVRRRLPSVRSGPAVPDFSVRRARRQIAGTFAWASMGVSAALFVWFVGKPLLAGQHLGAVAILFIAAANTVFLGSIVAFVSEAVNIRIDLIALACAAAFSFWNDNHDVQLAVLVPPAHESPALPPVATSYSDWLETLPNTSSNTVFVVAAEGGGIRAAYWTATVLGRLGEQEAGQFANQVYVVSGISGGTLGATVYAALRADGYKSGNLTGKAQEILSGDFLSPTVAKLVTGDIAQWFLPLPIHWFDRSTASEDAFSGSYRHATSNDTFTAPITRLMPDARLGIPALLMNMTIVETGKAAVIAPFTWTSSELPSPKQYTCWVGDCVRSGQDRRPVILAAPNIVQSVHNSARFTYVSPAGHVRSLTGASVDHVVDGGYFDPTGAETLLDLTRALRQADPSRRVVPIYITNATVPAKLNDAALQASKCGGGKSQVEPPPPSDDASRDAPIVLLGELLSPVQALLGTRAAHGQLAVKRQDADAAAITFGFCQMTKDEDTGAWRLPRDGEKPKTIHDPPLAWQLSRPMNEQLDAYMNVCAVNHTGVAAVKNWITAGCAADR
jgi:hypothetical protein